MPIGRESYKLRNKFESIRVMVNVIVVGAGPAGSAAAKKCVEFGLKTLVLEKRKLPRDKVCSGMVMGPVAQALVKQEFGDIPKTVLSKPYYLSGYIFHVPDIGNQQLDNHTPIGWRRDLDYWMSQQAQAKGAEIWECARVVDIRRKGQGFSVEIERDKKTHNLEASFVIGADGANSAVRQFLFPGLRVTYSQVYQECYRGAIDLDKDYFHWFYPLEYSPAVFTVHHKGSLLVIDVGGRVGQTKKLMAWAKHFLAQNYHFDISKNSVWRGGCLEPVLYKELTSYTFLPAKGNALLVGDAAGFLLPVSGEGIGTAIKSGLLAANSITKAIEQDQPADDIYLSEVKGIISVLKEISPWFRRIVEETKGSRYSLPEVLREAYQNTLRMF